MKKYYIEDSISYCFPYEISHKLSFDCYGVLKQYIGHKELEEVIDER